MRVNGDRTRGRRENEDKRGRRDGGRRNDP